MSQDFFGEDIPLRPEVVSGLFRESQIVVVAGPFNVGKSPLLADLGLHISKGITWNGRAIATPRPVIHFDFESSEPNFRLTYRNIALAKDIPFPDVPDEVEPYILNASLSEPRTRAMVQVTNVGEMFELLISILDRKPDGVIIFDPVELGFPIDVNKKGEVLNFYKKIRALFAKYPQASIVSSHNLRKVDPRRQELPDLLTDPHGWLQEISGSHDLVNRSDVRLGMDRRTETIRVVNGVRRSEDMHPLLLCPVDDNPDALGGYKRVGTDRVKLSELLSAPQLEYWNYMNPTFHFADYANNGIPKSSLSRLINRTLSLGLLAKSDDGGYIKIS